MGAAFFSTCHVSARLVSCDSLVSSVQYESHMKKVDKKTNKQKMLYGKAITECNNIKKVVTK